MPTIYLVLLEELTPRVLIQTLYQAYGITRPGGSDMRTSPIYSNSYTRLVVPKFCVGRACGLSGSWELHGRRVDPVRGEQNTARRSGQRRIINFAFVCSRLRRQSLVNKQHLARTTKQARKGSGWDGTDDPICPKSRESYYVLPFSLPLMVGCRARK